jgi:error-prone DNA polymerase
MGFYAPAQLVRDARAHGVEVRPIDVNHSRWDCTLEETGGRFRAVRLGLRMARGLANRDGALIPLARAGDAFSSIEEVRRRTAVPVSALERLAQADALRSLGLSRRDALWAIRGMSDAPLPLFEAVDRKEGFIRTEAIEPTVALTPLSAGGEVVEDYRSQGLTLRDHPLSFLRDDLQQKRMVPCSALRTMRDGRRVAVAGLVLVRQKPGSAKGVMFITIEDETDVANLVIWPSLFERQRRLILSCGLLGVRGRVQREGEVIHVVADELIDLSPLLHCVGRRGTPLTVPYGRGDEAKRGSGVDIRQRARPATQRAEAHGQPKPVRANG